MMSLQGPDIYPGRAQEFTPLAIDDSPDTLHQLTVQLKCLIQEKESRELEPQSAVHLANCYPALEIAANIVGHAWAYTIEFNFELLDIEQNDFIHCP